jgi:hypothetical protein
MTPAAAAEAARRQQIYKSADQFLQDHPGLSFKIAMLTVKHENPDLLVRAKSQ